MEHKRNVYQVDLPYPEPVIYKPNINEGKILLVDYTGQVSEMTAVTQYIYHHIYMEDKYEEVAEVLLGISIVEMKHLEMLANVIRQLGCDPKYRIVKNNYGINWTPNYIAYSKSVRNVLLDDISSEKKAIYNYKKTIQSLQNEEIIALIKRIILDEELHLSIFNELYKKYSK